MPPNWLVRSGDGAGASGPALPKEAVDAFQEFFDAEDLTTVVSAFTNLCQMLQLSPGKGLFIDPKLMQLGVGNQIVVVESNLKSKFDRGFRSDSKSNNESESTIVIWI